MSKFLNSIESDHWEFRADSDGRNRQKRLVFRDGHASDWEDCIEEDERMEREA